MSFYRNRVYPHLVNLLGDPKPIQKIRQRLIPQAEGRVLEIGVGPGVNFAHYDSGKVSKLYALEPNPGMVRRAEKQRSQTQLAVEFLDLPGERIPLQDASVDSVVSTFTLCTIPGVVEAIQGFKVYAGSSNRTANSSFSSTACRPILRYSVGKSDRNRSFAGHSKAATSPAIFRLSSARAASISNRWTQGTFLLFQSRGRTAGGAWLFPNEINDSRNARAC
jgi:Methyltransferase domain